MPEKKLFEQPLKQTLSLTDRMAFGVPNQEGCDNVLFSIFVRETNLNLAARYVGATSEKVFTLPNNSAITMINFKGAGTVKVTKDSDGDLVPETSINGEFVNPMWAYAQNQQNITISVSGTVTILIYYSYNVY